MHDEIWCNFEDVNINLKHKYSFYKYMEQENHILPI